MPRTSTLRTSTPHHVARRRHRRKDESRANATLNGAIVRECVKAWVAAYEHVSDDGEGRVVTESVDAILARHGIHYEFTRTPSLYRLYEHEIVRRARKQLRARDKKSRTPRPRGMRRLSAEAQDELVRRYVEDKCSTTKLAKEYGIGLTTVCVYLDERGIERRGRRGYTKERPLNLCRNPACGQPIPWKRAYSVRAHMSRKYCGHPCAMAGLYGKVAA